MGTQIEKVDGAGSQSDDRVDIEQVDRAAVPPVTLQSFAHLNEKAILRKVSAQRAVSGSRPASNILLTTYAQMDMRLIPMLALLYLLSFLDRS